MPWFSPTTTGSRSPAAATSRGFCPSRRSLARGYELLDREATDEGHQDRRVGHIPLHPVPSATLAETHLGGWAAMMGHAPSADDLSTRVVGSGVAVSSRALKFLLRHSPTRRSRRRKSAPISSAQLSTQPRARLLDRATTMQHIGWPRRCSMAVYRGLRRPSPRMLSVADHEKGAGIKHMYLNNVSAHPSEQDYADMARQMAATMPNGASIEVQWTDSPEKPGGDKGSRGHIDGTKLHQHISRLGRNVSYTITNDPESIRGEDFTVNSGKGGSVSSAAMADYTPPAPSQRAVIVFLDDLSETSTTGVLGETLPTKDDD